MPGTPRRRRWYGRTLQPPNRSRTRIPRRSPDSFVRPHGPSGIFKHARILIVDDEPGNVDVLRRLLERAGFTKIESTNDPREASDLYVRFRPDLILLDLHMPHKDGLAVMDDLNEIAEASYLPILMLTGDVTEGAKRDALSRGAKDFVHKPFNGDEVLLRIGTLLETRFLYLQIQSQNQMLEAKVRDRTREIEMQRGRQFDPVLVDAFLRVIEQREPQAPIPRI